MSQEAVGKHERPPRGGEVTLRCFLQGNSALPEVTQQPPPQSAAPQPPPHGALTASRGCPSRTLREAAADPKARSWGRWGSAGPARGQGTGSRSYPEGNSLRVGEILLGRGQAGQIDRAQPAPSAPAGSSGVRWVRWELRGHGVLPGT